MREITIDASFTHEVISGAQRQGLDCDPILLRNGISPLTLKNQHARVPLTAFASLAIEVMRELDDEYLGLSEKRQPVGSFNMMCRSCISARKLRRSLIRASHYWNLFENCYEHELIIDSKQACYLLRPRNETAPLNNYLAEAVLSATHRFHCWLVGQFLPLERVEMNFPEPSYSKEYTALFYGAPISYKHNQCRLVFSADLLDLEIVQTPETLEQYLLGTNLSLLYQAKNYRVISDQVRQWLEKTLLHGNSQPTLSQAAQHFQLSRQVLHRRLQAEDASFKEIKMQTRRDIAINLLFKDELKIEDIAYRVGFSEPSAFIRAFKSWTGLTPLAYRQTHG